MRLGRAGAAGLLAIACAQPAKAAQTFNIIPVRIYLPDYLTVPPEPCFKGEWKPTPGETAQLQPTAEPVLKAYLNIASRSGDVSAAFLKNKMVRAWLLDGVPGSPRKNFTVIRDPWAARVARLEQVGFVLGDGRRHFRAVWNAYDQAGTLLGTYDALFWNMKKGPDLAWLYLYSPQGKLRPKPLTEFCKEPGDVELYWALQERKQIIDANKRAQKEAGARRN